MSVMARTGVIVANCGDSAVRLTALDTGLDRRWRVVHAVAAALEDYVTEYSITGIIPTYDALLVEFDCSATIHDDIQRLLERLARQPAVLAPQRGRQFDIPVVYGGESGPDLDEVADQLDLAPEDVIRIHGSAPLTMRCFGSTKATP